MIGSSELSVPRCLAVGAGATTGWGLLVAWLLPVVLAPGAGTFDATLVRACAAVAVLAAGWLWLAGVLTVLDALRGRGRYAVGAPTALRRVVLAACGVALTGGVMAPAQATPGSPHEDRVTHSAAVLAGLPLPDRATAPIPGHVAAHASPVVVRAGDTLWAIAARTLGPEASDAEIDACWRRLYHRNRAEIGPDPDLIRPAQRLEVLP